MPQPSWRWKAWALTIVIGAIVAGVIMAKRLWVYRNIHEPLQRRAAVISAEMRARGARVGEPQLVDGASGAEQVVSLNIDNRTIRLLQFDSSKDAEAKELQHVHEQHATRALGTEQPAEDESGIVIVDFENHPRKEQILESFHKADPGR